MLRVFEAFAGVGSQRMALQNIGVEHEVVAISEIDKFAIASYEAIHGKVNNLGDISKLEEKDIPDHDLFTYSFPCQDISLAGKQGGFEKGSGTRSSLLWECNRVIESKKPKYLLLENVKNLVGKKFKPDFDEWLNHLESLGYKNYWQVLNAKDYGIPQNRERVFVVSILGEHEPYVFPEKQKLQLRLKDVLESEVDEKYYLSEEQTNRLSNNSFNQANKRLQEKEYSDTLLARDYKDPKVVRVGGVFDKENKRRQAGGIYDKEQLSTTLTTMEGGWRQPSVLIKNATKKGYLEATDGDGIDLAYPDSQTRRGRVQKGISQTLQTSDSVGTIELPTIAASGGRNPSNPSDRTTGAPTEQRLEINSKGVSNTLTTVQKDNYVLEPNVLTPKRTEYGKAIRKDYEKGLITESRHNMTALQPRTDGISNTLTTVQKDNYVLEGVDVHPFSKKMEFRGYKQKEISPCLLATDYKAPKTILESRTPCFQGQKDNPEDEMDSEGVVVEAKEESGRMGRQAVETLNENDVKHGDTINPFNKRVSSKDGISPTLTTRPEGFKTAVLPVVEPSGEKIIIDDTMGFEKEARVYENYSPALRASRSGLKTMSGQDFRIRKLTPLECWRLMGFKDLHFYKAQEVNSNSQLYKQAGNSIVVPVLEAIFKKIIKNEKEQTK